MYRAVLLDAYVLRPESSRPVVVSSTHTVYSAINLSRKSLRVFTSNDIKTSNCNFEFKFQEMKQEKCARSSSLNCNCIENRRPVTPTSMKYIYRF